jgi:glycine cleavage system aminomethyltransferase T
MAYGPSLGKNIAMGYLPADKAVEGDVVLIEYFGEHYDATVMKVGYGALLDPTNERPRS